MWFWIWSWTLYRLNKLMVAWISRRRFCSWIARSINSTPSCKVAQLQRCESEAWLAIAHKAVRQTTPSNQKCLKSDEGCMYGIKTNGSMYVCKADFHCHERTGWSPSILPLVYGQMFETRSWIAVATWNLHYKDCRNTRRRSESNPLELHKCCQKSGELELPRPHINYTGLYG